MQAMSHALDDSLRPAPGPGATAATEGSAPTARPRAGRRVTNRIGALIGLNQSTSLARRFLLASLLILLFGGLLVGWWVGNQLERGIIARSASITGLYVESFIEPHLESLSSGEWLTKADVASLDTLLNDTAFGEKIVALKIWRPDGVVVYSPDRSLIGESFPVDEDLEEALSGTVFSDISTLDNLENVSERARGFDRLLEMYIPVREAGSDRIVGAAEFYTLPTEIDQEVHDAQLQSWLAVAGGVAIVYLFLFGIVRQGSTTIDRQRVALQEQVAELQVLLDQNEQLRDRVRLAAERNTTLSERQLRRISSDLHDGPGQMLALAALRLDEVERSTSDSAGAQATADVKSALNDALRDMRSIAAGLRLPELRTLSTADAVRRAVDAHQRRTSVSVSLEVGALPHEAPLPTKIALFRATQELLSNATRHGQGRDVAVRLDGDRDEIRLAVADRGPGFDSSRVGAEGHLGLAGIREQAEILGGGFDVTSRDGGGATVTVRWPL
jgi:signal transduction histidine kinase